jgi:hypothetical protein
VQGQRPSECTVSPKKLRFFVELLRVFEDECVGISAPTARERVARLEEAGVIKGWHMEVDAVALGYPVLAFVRVRPIPGELHEIAELAGASRR